MVTPHNLAPTRICSCLHLRRFCCVGTVGQMRSLHIKLFGILSSALRLNIVHIALGWWQSNYHSVCFRQIACAFSASVPGALSLPGRYPVARHEQLPPVPSSDSPFCACE